MARSYERAFLDRPLARGVAVLVFLACMVTLAWLERARLFPSEVTADTDRSAACIAERSAQIDGMLAEGVIEAPQAELFKTRAVAMCRDTAGHGGGPGLPGLPPQ